ncbi:MurR/RpiR family transcriptional regulator [Gilliamella sp. wkB112]|uniref:MurR/RpiR family transcriptional regulator n=1 Tax=Gilliamella sp. wkB112 TaxID=3120257 RepID=UPI00080DFBAA|nr:MurR/RpiR family transcriptional regulator [Gilliamella apicola]OCG02994.1 hypothetical protein A9G12_08710 [Gilliamella apicola]
MDFNMIFPNLSFTSKEYRLLCYMAEHIDHCLSIGIRQTAETCYSSSSTLIRLSHKLGFSGFTELLYFLKFKLLDGSNTIQSNLNIEQIVQVIPDDGFAKLKTMIKDKKILLHGNGFSQLVAQYYYNRLLMLGSKTSISLWTDFDILAQQNHNKPDVVWIISKSGRSHYVINWLDVAHKYQIPIVSFTGNTLSPLAQQSEVVISIKDHNQYDDNICFSTPFFGYSLLAFEYLLSKL